MQLDLFKEAENTKLLVDLFKAYYDSRRNKRNTINALNFEIAYETNLFKLYEELISGSYVIKPSICFINEKPVKREIFAADFRDRIVHHLVYNYIAPVFEKRFIHDSYSCRLGKGTHYGIKRVNRFIRSCSRNYHEDCYILKMDIKGYFMSMERNLLYSFVREELLKKAAKLDFNLPLTMSLIEKIIFNDPTKNYVLKGSINDWNGLPPSKSLFHSGDNKGLPIGNLTSQLFSNIYLNPFDHFVKKDLGIKYYGRYVDDFVIIHPDKTYLRLLISKIREYLKSELKLEIHPKKIYLQHYTKGVQFLGAVIKPYRMYVATRTKTNFYHAIASQNAKLLAGKKPSKEDCANFLSSMNSYLGILKHYKSFKLRGKLINQHLSAEWLEYFQCDNNSLFIKGKS